MHLLLVRWSTHSVLCVHIQVIMQWIVIKWLRCVVLKILIWGEWFPFYSSCFLGKCPTGWHHYEGTASCYRVYLNGENYWDAVQTCQRVNGSLATFTADQELRFILAQEWDLEEKTFVRKDQRRWVGRKGQRSHITCKWLLCDTNSGSSVCFENLTVELALG